MERVYIPVIYCISIPFVNDFVLGLRQKIASITAIVVLLVFSLWGIVKVDRFYRNRIKLMNELLASYEKYPERKYILANKDPQTAYWFTWSYSFETLMLSSLHGPKNGVTIYPAKDQDVNELQKKGSENVFLAADFWLTWDCNMLNDTYFVLPKTSYRVVLLPQ